MTIATTQTYRTVAVRAADLDRIIQIQEVRGWDFVTAFPTATGADELTDELTDAQDSDMHDTTQGEAEDDVEDQVEDAVSDPHEDRDSRYIMIFRKRDPR